MLKIIGGQLSGRTIASLPGKETRPPLSRVRAALANILMEYVQGADILDLFAGTGSYSFELLSRGAASATMVDKNPKAYALIKDNASRLGLNDKVRVRLGDSTAIIPDLFRRGLRYDIVLSAPPYFTGLDIKSMELLSSFPLIKSTGIVVLQQHRKEEHRKEFGVLKMKKLYKYGDTIIQTYLVHPEDGEIT